MERTAIKTPWHLWVVGALGAIWNGLGSFDYTVTMRLKDDAYISQFVTPEKVAFFHNMPLWADFSWGLGVYGGLVGSMLLLARSRYAFPVFLASLAGLVGCTLYEYVLSTPDALALFKQGGKVGFVLSLWAVAISLPTYANRMEKSGILR